METGLDFTRHRETALHDAHALLTQFDAAVEPFRSRSPQVLDFGCGQKGLSRSYWSVILRNEPGSRLFLYDPAFQSEGVQGHIPEFATPISELDGIRQETGEIDIVNLSYVLCLLEINQAAVLIQQINRIYPEARLLIADYILKNRSRADVLNLLTTESELEWLGRLGENNFVETHTRFNLWDLFILARQGGRRPKIKILPSGYRAAIHAI